MRWTPHRSPLHGGAGRWAITDGLRPWGGAGPKRAGGCGLRRPKQRCTQRPGTVPPQFPTVQRRGPRRTGASTRSVAHRVGSSAQPRTELPRLLRCNAPKCYGGAGRGRGQENSGPDAKEMPRAGARLLLTLLTPPPPRPPGGALICACAVPKGGWSLP